MRKIFELVFFLKMLTEAYGEICSETALERAPIIRLSTGNGKKGEHFPVRERAGILFRLEKSGNFVSSKKWNPDII